MAAAVRLRPYAPADDDALEALERDAMMGPARARARRNRWRAVARRTRRHHRRALAKFLAGSRVFRRAQSPAENRVRIPAQAWLRAVVRVEFCHHGRFDAKQRQFDDHAVVVAEAPDGGVVGVVCVAVKKNVTVAGQARTAGYVSGLRVASTWQRKGVGRLLAGRAEAAAADRGVDYLYVSVNASNPRARRFFADRGYAVAARAGTTRGAFAILCAERARS